MFTRSTNRIKYMDAQQRENNAGRAEPLRWITADAPGALLICVRCMIAA